MRVVVELCNDWKMCKQCKIIPTASGDKSRSTTPDLGNKKRQLIKFAI